jgi:hypothetical protein
MQRRGADALAPALQHGIGAAALAKLGVEPGVRWYLRDAVVDPHVNDAGEGLTTQTCVEARMIITVYLKICVKLGVSWKWRLPYRRISPSRYLYRQDSQGREARRSAGHAVDQVRVRNLNTAKAFGLNQL